MRRNEATSGGPDDFGNTLAKLTETFGKSALDHQLAHLPQTVRAVASSKMPLIDH